MYDLATIKPAASRGQKEYQITIVNPLNDPRWDSFVAKHPRGWIVHHSGWRQVLERTFPQINGYYISLIDKSDNQIQAGLPIFEVKSWLTRNRLVSIPFATVCEPLVSNSYELDLLINSAIDIYRQRRFSFIEIKSLSDYWFSHRNDLIRQDFYKYHYINLDMSLDNIWKRLHYKSVRYEINKAKRSSLAVSCATCHDDVKEFYRLYSQTRRGLGLPSQPFVFFESLWDIFSGSKNIIILFAKSENGTAAAHLLFHFNRHASLEAIGWDVSFSGKSPNHLLMWQAIQLAHAKGCKIFDLGRTSPNNTSLMDFKKRWGTHMINIPSFYYNKQKENDAVDRDQSGLYKTISYACKMAPRPIYEALSNFCYRHLG